jgi:8-oxo-dGTP pyrophosphatase MutT (NUDIX family)
LAEPNGLPVGIREQRLNEKVKKTPEIKPSATVLLLRAQSAQIEVLMTRRHGGMSFMAGLWVYPGGKVDSADMSPDALGRLTPEARVRCAQIVARGPMSRFPLEQSLGMFVAACRETFEEIGVLLACDAAGKPCPPALIDQLQPHRKASIAAPESFIEMLVRHDLKIDASELVYWAHWITPSAAPKRFDTNFFVIPAPQGQEIRIDTSEATEWTWIEPTHALAAHDRGEFPLSPPTVLTLQEISNSFAAHGSLPSMLAAEGERRVATVLPKAINGPTENFTLMPWHPDYHAAPGEGVPAGIDYPAHLLKLPGRVNRKHDFSGKPLP